MQPINLMEQFATFSQQWCPQVVAALNGQQIKLVKLQGAFVWHRHEHADELFLVWRGRLVVEFRDRAVQLGPGELLVVPRGVEHRTVAADEVEVLLFEPVAAGDEADLPVAPL